MDVVKYILDKYNPEIPKRSPIELKDVNRIMLTQLFHELDYKVGAEIGVAQGKYSTALCENIPGLKLYCVDVWDRYDGYKEYTDRIDRYYLEAQERLNSYNAVFVKKFSMDAVKDFEYNSLDFVYIDAAHDFKNVADDVCEWTKRVKVGGIVYGHDYCRWKHETDKYIVDVKDVVQAYCYAKDVNPWFVLGPTEKIEGQEWDGKPNWMFVRQETDLTGIV
jgi:predicted O-methyltransferase YrrM